MDMLSTSAFWVALAQIMVVNIMLSGDNAVVIALASRSLPPKQQKMAILFGSGAAIVLRIVLTFFAVMLMELPYLKLVGGLTFGLQQECLIPITAKASLSRIQTYGQRFEQFLLQTSS